MKLSATPGDPDEATLSGWAKNVSMLLYADEKPIYRALLAHCDNQVAIALGANEGYLVDLRWHQLLLRNLISFQGTKFR